ncbi:nuclear poly(A) polymerase 3-like [Oryza glaberrima]|uniref:nuclear poly(A) polymerase 3-like n=1 Tax=Oryza glaberrima TaxID=4538 RepID=UPI00224C4136|nr:nuclear poly(A) polymerase 3-like [Oryza glaberrima]
MASARATDPLASRDPPTLPLYLPPPPPPPLPSPSPHHRLLHAPMAPILLHLHPAFLAQMDSRRTTSLLQFLKDEGGIPSPEADKKREQVIRKLSKIVMDWAKVVAYEQRVPPRRATATVLTYGSYTLGAHGPESDIDALCVGPCIATLQYHFFIVLRQILEDRPEVSELQTVESAKVPLMRFRFSGISVDFTYAQLPVIDASEAIITYNPHLLQKLDSRSWRSLSGVRVNEQIVQLVPNAQKFQILLRCIKLWAKRRGIHCHLLGFFAGIHLAILAAYVCQRYPYGTINGLFTIFFDIFAHWNWQIPVSLHGQPTNCRRPNGSFMPILLPCTPPEFCTSNMTKGTFKKIREELMRGYALTKEPWRHDFEWVWLFAPFPYATKYEEFLRIALCAPTSEELRDWAGWVKSRFRNLILKLESIGVECDPDSTEEVDHTVFEPSIVCHWGLIYKTSTHIDISSLGEDFMKDVINDVYGKVKGTHSKLTMSIVRSSQLPKSLYSHSHSVYTPYIPQYMLGYQTPTDYSGAAG